MEATPCHAGSHSSFLPHFSLLFSQESPVPPSPEAQRFLKAYSRCGTGIHPRRSSSPSHAQPKETANAAAKEPQDGSIMVRGRALPAPLHHSSSWARLGSKPKFKSASKGSKRFISGSAKKKKSESKVKIKAALSWPLVHVTELCGSAALNRGVNSEAAGVQKPRVGKQSQKAVAGPPWESGLLSHPLLPT